MTGPQQIARHRRRYNQWVASQTLEDYALRYTAEKARRWAPSRVAGAAIGASSFLACEAIGASITLAFGFANSVAAIATAVVLMFLFGLPIAYQAARNGLDVDLLTRGAGFGYLGSTVTSLIYASFTFLLFAIEASIMSVALEMLLGIPLALAHLVSALAVIPITIYGMSAIQRMQHVTQPVWIVLQLAPIVYILWKAPPELGEWTRYIGRQGAPDGSVSLVLYGLALSTLLSLLPQIGEQSDYLRFLPSQKRIGKVRWWGSLLAGGPGWALIGGVKLLVGSFLAYYVVQQGLSPAEATSPSDMFYVIFGEMARWPQLALVLTVTFVVVCQLKINVTNAYAGSIAWSNFFSRLTHAHPGRVVWLVFNVLIALLLMEIGILRAIEAILVLYANLAAGWMGALAADLIICKPLGLSPRHIEFKRAHLYDVNPVGIGAMGISILISSSALVGLAGPVAQAFAPLIGLLVAFLAVPLLAIATKGRFYIARQSPPHASEEALKCTICENAFEPADMAYCPAYSASICSLCCTLETRCHDLCKDRSTVAEQTTMLLEKILPRRLARSIHTTTGHFTALVAIFILAQAAILYAIYFESGVILPDHQAVIATTLWTVFLAFSVISCIAAWLLVLAHNSRRAAEQESANQTARLVAEIEAHKRTDAALQRAKEAAETANMAKSRYLVGVSHEIRSPLNSIYGYAQLLERDSSISPHEAGRVIRRSSEHLTNLVEGLLDISRIESGVLRLSRDTVRLHSFLDQVADMFRLQATSKGLNYKYERAANLPEVVRTDQKRLRQVLINLLSNAVKYTRAGEVSFTVRYRSQIAEFEISDTGIGIRPEDIERIFTPFERAGEPGTQVAHGVGLGLSITKVLVHVMGGDIVVQSTPDVGSQFIVRLMLAEPLRSSGEPSPLVHVAGYRGERRKIAIIDDDAAQLGVLRQFLEPIGFTVLTAMDAYSGIEMVAEQQPDLVMLDIAMPEMSGWTVAGKLRESHGNKLKILMVSANAHEYSVGGDGQALHDRFLIKPLNLDALLDMIAELLGLEWIEGTAKVTDAPREEEQDAAEPPPSEAEPYLEQLEALGRIGHVKAIQEKIAEMQAAVPRSAGFAARLMTRVKAFDVKGFLAMVKAHRS